MQLPYRCSLKNYHVAALNGAMPHITHSMFLPCESPASEINIFYFVMSLYLPDIFLVILGLFFLILASLPHLLLYASLSLGPDDPGSGPGSVPVDINVIYVSVGLHFLIHLFNKCYSAPGSVQSTRNITQNKANMVPVLTELSVYKNEG